MKTIDADGSYVPTLDVAGSIKWCVLLLTLVMTTAAAPVTRTFDVRGDVVVATSTPRAYEAWQHTDVRADETAEGLARRIAAAVEVPADGASEAFAVAVVRVDGPRFDVFRGRAQVSRASGVVWLEVSR